MNVRSVLNLNSQARRASHVGFKQKAWREYGLGDDNQLYQRGPTSGFGYSDWTPLTNAGITYDKVLLQKMAEAFLDKTTLLKILARK